MPEDAAELSDRLGMASPAVAHAERAGSDLLPKQFEHAWEAFSEIVPADVAGRSCGSRRIRVLSPRRSWLRTARPR